VAEKAENVEDRENAVVKVEESVEDSKEDK